MSKSIISLGGETRLFFCFTPPPFHGSLHLFLCICGSKNVHTCTVHTFTYNTLIICKCMRITPTTFFFFFLLGNFILSYQHTYKTTLKNNQQHKAFPFSIADRLISPTSNRKCYNLNLTAQPQPLVIVNQIQRSALNSYHTLTSPRQGG